MGRARRAAARGAEPMQGAKYVTGIIGNMMLVNSAFRMRNNFSEDYPQFGHALSKSFASPVLGRKSLRNISLKQG